MLRLLCVVPIRKEQFMIEMDDRGAINMMRKIYYSHPSPLTLLPSVLVIDIYDVDNKTFYPSNYSVVYWYWRQFEKYEYRPEYEAYYPTWKKFIIKPTIPSLKEECNSNEKVHVFTGFDDID